MKKEIRQRIDLFSDRSIGSKAILTAQVSFLLLIISLTPVSAYAKGKMEGYKKLNIFIPGFD